MGIFLCRQLHRNILYFTNQKRTLEWPQSPRFGSKEGIHVMMLTWFLWGAFTWRKQRLHHSYVISESCVVEPRQLYYLIVSWWVSEPLIQKEKKKSEVWLKLLSCYSLIPVVMSFHFRLTTHDQAWRERGLFAPCSDDLHLHFFGRTVKIFGHFALAWLFLDAKSS